MSLKKIRPPMVQLPPVQPGVTTKEVGWNYPSSPNASKFKMPKTGCYAVSLIENTGTENVRPPKAIAAFKTEREAFDHAEKMPEPYHPVMTYFSAHPNPYKLKEMIEQFCEWLKEASHRVPTNAEGFDWSILPNGQLAAVSGNAAQLISEAFGGRVAKYTHERNPAARVNGDEETNGQKFEYTVALVGQDNRLLVDWKSAALCNGEKFVYDNRDPEDAKKIRELHGPEPKWTYPTLGEEKIVVYHAKEARGVAPTEFDPARYVKVAEVLAEDVGVALELTSNRPYEGPTEHLRGQVMNWYAQPQPDPRLLIYGGVRVSTLPDPTKGFARPDDVVETAGVLSETRQTWPDDVFVLSSGQAYTAFDHQPIPNKSVVDLKRKHEVEAAASLLPSAEVEPTGETLSV